MKNKDHTAISGKIQLCGLFIFRKEWIDKPGYVLG